MRKAAIDIASVAEELRAAGSQVHQAVQGAPGYDGQFGPQVASIGLEAHARSRALADRLAELSSRLAAKAEAFEAVDAASLQGLASIQRELLAWVHSQGEFPLAPLLIPIDWGDDSPTLAEQLEALITRPPWWVARDRPPNIPVDAWAYMNMAERTATLEDSRAPLRKYWDLFEGSLASGDPPELWVVAADGMLVRPLPSRDADPLGGLENFDTASWNGQARWGEDGRLWYHVSTTVGATVITGWVAAWEWGEKGKGEVNLAPAIREGDNFGWAPVADTKGYGDAWQGWAAYRAQGASAAQYLDVREILRQAGFEEWEKFPPVHNNLCGELAIFKTTGVSLEEGMKAFAAMERGSQILGGGSEAYAGDLKGLFNELGWSDAQISHPRDFSGFADQFSPTGEVTVLVTINKLTGIPEVPVPNSQQQAGHWVNLLSIDDTSITVYNPFSNRQEVYNRADFAGAWSGTVIDSGQPDTTAIQPSESPPE